MAVKDDLHHLVDELDEDAAREALARLKDLRLARETTPTTRELDALATWRLTARAANEIEAAQVASRADRSAGDLRHTD